MLLKQFRNKWGAYPFYKESGPEAPITSKECVKDFRKSLRDTLAQGYTLHGFRHNHFTASGFVEKGGKFVYISIGDFRNHNWVNNILYRTAESTKDFRGGRNRFTSVNNLEQALINMFKQ